MHLDSEAIQRLLHGELDESRKRESEFHLTQCAACHATFETAELEEAWVFDRLEALDHPAPARAANAPWTKVPQSARAGWFERFDGFLRAGWFASTAGSWVPRAAALALMLTAAAAAAYVLPGSPFRTWIDEIAGRGDAPKSSGLRIPGIDSGASHPASVDRAAGPAGIAVEPHDHLVVQFAAPQASGEIVVSIGTSSLVSVRVVGGAAKFDTDAASLGILNRDSAASYEIELPADAPSIEIRVAGRVRLTKRGSQIVSDATVDADGRYRLALVEGTNR